MNVLVQEVGSGKQTLPQQNHPTNPSISGLGEPSIQLNSFRIASRLEPSRTPFVVSKSFTRLQALKRKHFTGQDRTRRIERSLAALHQPETLQLTPQEWRFFAEDPDLNDQD
jgi:hypothetical protein